MVFKEVWGIKSNVHFSRLYVKPFMDEINHGEHASPEASCVSYRAGRLHDHHEAAA